MSRGEKKKKQKHFCNHLPTPKFCLRNEEHLQSQYGIQYEQNSTGDLAGVNQGSNGRGQSWLRIWYLYTWGAGLLESMCTSLLHILRHILGKHWYEAFCVV